MPIAQEGGLYMDICAGGPELLVMPLLVGHVSLLGQSRFKSQSIPLIVTSCIVCISCE